MKTHASPRRGLAALVYSLVAAALLATGSALRADIVFDSAKALDNFTVSYTASAGNDLAFVNSNGGYATTSANGLLTTRYTGSSYAFRDETISVGFSVNSFANTPSLGLYLRVNETTGLGVFANLTLQTDGKIQFRFWGDGSSTTSATLGTQLANVNSASALSLNTSYLFVVAEGINSDGRSFFNLSVKDASGSSTVATSGDILLSAGSTYDAAGGLALRFNYGTRFDLTSLNGTGVTAIPEPASLAALLGAAGLSGALLVRRRRHRAC